MSSEKRPASQAAFGSSQIVKRQKSDANMANGSSTALTTGAGAGSQSRALTKATGRPSGLPAPVMELAGHTGEVFAARFDPTGQHIASGSMDRSILLWRATGDCENYGALSGHKGAVLDLHWARDSRAIFSASADTHLAAWDAETGQRLRRYVGHEEIVNCLDVAKRGEEILLSGSDDGYIGLWDARQKEAISFLETPFPVTALALSEAGNELYTGSIDNDVKVWDVRKRAPVYALLGHADTVTSLAVSPDGAQLLSHSFDAAVRTWDVRPFAPPDRALRTYDGVQMGLERNLCRACWDGEGKRIAAAGGDGAAVVWEAWSARLVSRLPGHRGAVNDVRFKPGDGSIGELRFNFFFFFPLLSSASFLLVVLHVCVLGTILSGAFSCPLLAFTFPWMQGVEI
ncbi:U5 snRNP complex subunit [Lineolata rhizophorae]|uniref:U5 snRNP complex subunit n=1 Tax=Lineolata rhizophorae TaxID=578093 RepID=A0A6A6P2W9_9PEZI|nr:U5 snRNP complex subunit [Lineolata rhizophorae]